jgi:hypothetical protein
MYEDRIDINGSSYKVHTTENSEGVFSVIYTEKSNRCEIIQRNDIPLENEKEKDMALKTLHEKFLSMLFRSIKKSGGDSELSFEKSDDTGGEGNEPLPSRGEDRQGVEEGKSNEPFRNRLLEFCRREVDGSIEMCLLTDGDSVAVYYRPEMEQSLHEYLQNEVMKIMEAADRNRERLLRMIGESRQIIVSAEDYNYFYVVLGNGLVSVMVTPGGQLGRYVREIERFNQKLSRYFSENVTT